MKHFILLALLVATAANIQRHKHGGTYRLNTKPGTKKNKLFAKYGTNFKYVGEVKNGLDRVTVVTSIPIPKYVDIDRKPMEFKNCSVEKQSSKSVTTEMNEWYAKSGPICGIPSEKEKAFYGKTAQFSMWRLMCSTTWIKTTCGHQEWTKVLQRPWYNFASVVPGLITLAVKSLSSYLKVRQQRRIDETVVTMRRDQQMTYNRLQQYLNDFLMYCEYNVETLTKVINTVNSLHKKQTELENAFGNTQFGQVVDVMDAMTFNFDLQVHLRLSEEDHVKQYEQLVKASKDLLKGIATLSQGWLPQENFPDRRLKEMLREVENMVKKHYPDYELAADHLSHYRDMKLVTFAVDQEAHCLIVAFPAFIKDYRKLPLSMFEIETVPVPIPDKNRNADSYSKVHIHTVHHWSKNLMHRVVL